jgi:ABC-type proline/glycine betaine transport system substrate-binding protein
MSIFESVIVGAICMALVFAVLAVLYGMISLITKSLSNVGKKGATEEKSGVIMNDTVSAPSATAGQTAANSYSAGELKLKNVDEKTAAMIMAIVSHESKMPLNELIFKSISAVE